MSEKYQNADEGTSKNSRQDTTMQKIIVDGYNLIYAHPELKKKIGSEALKVREILIRVLAEYIRTRKEKLILVFDSSESGVLYKLSTPSRLEVRFSKPGLTADKMIVKMMQSEPEPQKLTVVSSDYKDIGMIAKSLGVELLSSEAFWRRVSEKRKVDKKDEEKPTSVSESEVEYWLKEFETRRKNSES
jgi:predicted RNA-binding protein with PIN domain